MAKMRYLKVDCRTCTGRGWVQSKSDRGWPVVCAHCRGQGKEPDTCVAPAPIPTYMARSRIEGGHQYFDPSRNDA